MLGGRAMTQQQVAVQILINCGSTVTLHGNVTYDYDVTCQPPEQASSPDPINPPIPIARLVETPPDQLPLTPGRPLSVHARPEDVSRLVDLGPLVTSSHLPD